MYTSGFGPDGAMYIGRIFWTHSLQVGGFIDQDYDNVMKLIIRKDRPISFQRM